MARRASAMPVSLILYLAFVISARAATGPVAATWSTETFGPDGPWPAVEVIVGDKQRIAMYPGSEGASFLLTNAYCSYNSSLPCYGSQTGLYNEAESTADQIGSNTVFQYAPPPNYMLGLGVSGTKATSWVADIDLQGDAGTVANVPKALLDESFASYPDGSWYPLSVGCLGIGSPGSAGQTLSTDSGSTVNASLIPGYLSDYGTTRSNSFSMHIGSTSPRMPGSLYFGGYDKNRVVGEVFSAQGDYNKEITLKDISIQVVDGTSPFDFGMSQTGLLAQGNSSIGTGGIQAHIGGCTPYLSLPASTCNAIASHLPMTYNAKLGLYIWNINDPKYSQIVNSALALNFTFLGATNTEVSISVPFPHLNLTLTAPLVSTSQQYFPCFTGSDQYTLGRAFLQDAFVGANWGSNTWWLSQAPGPNVPSPNVVELGSTETTISASSNDWKESWSGSWNVLTPAEVSASASVAAPTPIITTTAAAAGSTGVNSIGNVNSTVDYNIGSLSTDAQAGIGSGVGVAGLTGVLGLIFCFSRRRRAKAEAVKSKSNTGSNTIPTHGHDEPAQTSNSPQQPPAELYSPPRHTRQEQQQGVAAELPGVIPTPQELPATQQKQHQYSDASDSAFAQPSYHDQSHTPTNAHLFTPADHGAQAFSYYDGGSHY